MNKFALSILAFLLFASFQVLSAAPASRDLIKRLDQKITYKSEGDIISSQLKSFSKLSDVYIQIDSSAQPSLKLTTKKFFYKQVRAKYIFYRLMKEAGLKYKFDGDIIEIYKENN